MEKKELKLKKETLTNLTNLNIREMEEIKGGQMAMAEQRPKTGDMSYSISLETISGTGLTWSW